MAVRCVAEHRNVQKCEQTCEWGPATWMMAVELGGVKTGGLSLMSEISMFKVTVEDIAGEPLSNACTDREYLDT